MQKYESMCKQKTDSAFILYVTQQNGNHLYKFPNKQLS